jgi:hypothetical protein
MNILTETYNLSSNILQKVPLDVLSLPTYNGNLNVEKIKQTEQYQISSYLVAEQEAKTLIENQINFNNEVTVPPLNNLQLSATFLSQFLNEQVVQLLQNQTLPASSDEVFDNIDINTLHLSLAQDQYYGLTVLNGLLSSAQRAINMLNEPLLEQPICPYKQTINKYLGNNYQHKKITDIIVPKNFDTNTVVKQCDEFIEKISDNAMKQYEILATQQTSNHEEGALGNSFAVLSGDKFVIDTIALSKYLEFAEFVRNISITEYITNPLETAKKLLYVYSWAIS